MGIRRAFGAAMVWGLWARGATAAAPPVGAGGAPGASAIAPSAGAAGQGTKQPNHNWKPLRSAEATATSFLQNDWNQYQENYHPSYVLDENPATAWVEGAKGFGEDESSPSRSPWSARRALSDCACGTVTRSRCISGPRTPCRRMSRSP